MTLTVNGEQIDLPAKRATVQDLVADRGFSGSACAVEVNRALVPHRERATRELHEGDIVEIVTLVGGG